jgi:hypothetical protein
MKKPVTVFLAVAVLGVLASCKSSANYNQPDFERPLAYVIDTKGVAGRMEDYVKLHNQSSDSNMSFEIYAHDPGSRQWIYYGRGVLKDKGDTDTIDSSRDLDNYRYLAVAPLNDKDYAYQVYKKNNDLHIDILDK